jgi:hypothetical protein
MGKFDPKVRDLNLLYDFYGRGKINPQPDYQRGPVWEPKKAINLVDSILKGLPIGIVMLNIVTDPDNDREIWDVVDGQQRLTTLFSFLKYKRADKDKPLFLQESQWKKANKNFRYFDQLSEDEQDRVKTYPVALGFLSDFDGDEIKDIYSRLQEGKALKIGERVKAYPGPHMEFIRRLSEHRIFAIAGFVHRKRNANFKLAASFYKSVYNANPFERIEEPYLKEFVANADKFNEKKAEKTEEETKRHLNYLRKLINEGQQMDTSFEERMKVERDLKWLFALAYLLSRNFAITGREKQVAKGVLEYWRLRSTESTRESYDYLRTGRSGKMDTDKVKICVNQLITVVINEAGLEPLDPKRFFSRDMRSRIYAKSQGLCSQCRIEISRTNFHADHVTPHSKGGKTTIENGQALCVKCNVEKGNTNYIAP